ncbi:hypothetical protein VM1G_05056 [Cytospora mali]|uniref:Uncharacterized protein n=1 Tax=Cytospora mali TaxID=578113 RepID=A0A194W142_CYTMA|nr:hypothetical protein VM1G_05056 [Valsa mali]
MAQIERYNFTSTFNTIHKRASLPGTTPLFVGSFDDNMLCHGPQFVKPIDTSFITTHISTFSKRSSFTSSPISEISSTDDEESAVLGDDDDEYSEDELPPSPKRRHSGAMSISEEELPFCYDREALRRETAAHRARQHQHHHHNSTGAAEPLREPQRQRAGTFAAHEQWDSEVDGPSMALWVPEQQSGAEYKRRRTEKTTPSSSLHRREVPPHHHVSHIEGAMMCLWEA